MRDFTFLQISSLNKVFLDENYSNLTEINGTSAFLGERVSYQILYIGGKEDISRVKFKVKADDRIDVLVRKVGNVPVHMAARSRFSDEFFLRKTPGLYPDVLYPICDNIIDVNSENCHSLFITAQIPEDLEAGIYPILIEFEYNGENTTKAFEIKVLNEKLPEIDFIYTQWFYADCIASYYNFEIFSDKHWEMIEKFIKMAAHTGINLILTPIFTPPLDTDIGLERPTVQLVDIEYINGKYSFKFDKLKRWIDICKKYDICKFEMAHLFTQWGTGCTPKIQAKTENGSENIFGWHVKSNTIEYKAFLQSFLPELSDFLKSEGVYENTYFHISDEPEYDKHFELYKSQREMVEGLIPEDRIMDAMSHVEFCENGLAKLPVVVNSAVENFIKKGYKDIWAYVSCIPAEDGYSNRFIAMPSSRNRIFGVQLYKYDLKGFLHWGYNFYYSRLSRYKINPFVDTSAGEGFPSGDAFTVYPGGNGPLESLRAVSFFEGLQDMRACKLLEKYIGRDAVIDVIDSECEIKWNVYPRTDARMLGIRERINKYIEEELSKI